MKKFRLIPAIYLYNGQVVDKKTKNVTGDGDAVSLAVSYGNIGADELLIFDISETDSEHDKNISTMIKMADESDIPMIVGGNVKRLEDVKKYLYTGAKKAFLDLSKESNVALIKEAADRFGKEQIAGIMSQNEIKTKADDIISSNISLLIMNQTATKSDDIKDLDVLMLCDSFLENEAVSFAKNKTAYGYSALDLNREFDFMAMKNVLKAHGINVNIFESKMKFHDFKTNADGMIPVIVQDYKTNNVLMLAYMNEKAFNLTIQTGKMTYYSRSRDEIWVKGETSGHYQYVKELSMDCDLDTMLAKVHQVGVPCHTGAETCFFNELVKKEYDETNPMKVFEDVFNVISDRRQNPKEGSYTNYLFDKGIDKILKKVGEEATEIVIAAKNPDPQEITYEISDFIYHIMVLMVEKGVSWKEITKELSRR